MYFKNFVFIIQYSPTELYYGAHYIECIGYKTILDLSLIHI